LHPFHLRIFWFETQKSCDFAIDVGAKIWQRQLMIWEKRVVICASSNLAAVSV